MATAFNYAEVRELVARFDVPMVVSPYVVAEIDHLVATRVGTGAELEVLAELSGGAYILPDIGRGDLARAVDLLRMYRDQEVGVADASIVLLADRYATRKLLRSTTATSTPCDQCREVGSSSCPGPWRYV